MRVSRMADAISVIDWPSTAPPKCFSARREPAGQEPGPNGTIPRYVGKIRLGNRSVTKASSSFRRFSRSIARLPA